MNMSSASHVVLVSIVSALVFTTACRKDPPASKATATAPSAPALTPMSASSPLAAAAIAARPSGPAPSTPAPPSRKPTPLDEAGLRAAKAYSTELGRGRKATVAKDFVQAEEHFSKSLEALPGDARALAERGYARLLASKLPEAEADLAAAARAAPSSAVLLQILHNRMLVARQQGDEKAAKRFEDEQQKLKAARRLPSGVTCSSEVTASDLTPKIAKSVGDALELLLAAHAANDQTQRSSVQIVEGPLGGPNEAERLKVLAAQGPLPDGGWQLWSQGNLAMNHALIAHAGKLYAFPNQSQGGLALCGLDGAAEVTVGGGGAKPWYIQRSFLELQRGYLCEKPNNGSGPCGGEDDGPELHMGFCGWASTRIDVTILDSKNLEGIRTLSVSAQPSDGSASEPEHILELEWQADKVAVDACGQHTLVPYAAE
jgi:tetratricopeptide (TPR) repeat protein